MLNLLHNRESQEIIVLIKENLFSYDKYIHTENDTRQAVLETLGKSLKDYWAGNTKNMHMVKLMCYKYITLHFIDEDILKNNPFILIEEKKFINLNHDDLASTVINRLCDSYFITPDVYLPHQQNSSSMFNTFFKKFKK